MSPLAGFLNANGERCTFDYALDNADTHEFPYPYPVIKGIIEGTQDRGEYISATSILHCIRAEFLKRTEPYYLSVDSAYAMFRGTLFHALMEKHAEPGARIEEKHLRSYKGIEIGGTFDSLRIHRDGETTIVEDWKTTKSLPKYDTPYSSHIKQVNLYRWLLGLDPDKVQLVVWYFSMEGVKRTQLKDGKGKTRGGRQPARQVWTDAEVETFLDDRLMKLRASFVTRIPMPYAMVPQEDKWECDLCPIRERCNTLALEENKAIWRREEGLSPEGTEGDGAALWGVLLDDFTVRMRKAFEPRQTALPASSDAPLRVPVAVPKPVRKTRKK